MGKNQKGSVILEKGLITTQGLGLFERRGKVWVSSRDIAIKFEKKHKHVLDKINYLVAEKSATKNLFYETIYIDDRGKKYPEYLMGKKGFSILAMRFTGDKALEWQLMYVDAFDHMEQILTERQNAEWQYRRAELKPIRRELTDVVKETNPSKWAYKQYTDLAYKMAIGKTAKQLREMRGADKNTVAVDYMTAEEIYAVTKMQARITVLVEVGMDYQQVKSTLANSQLQTLTA